MKNGKSRDSIEFAPSKSGTNTDEYPAWQGIAGPNCGSVNVTAEAGSMIGKGFFGASEMTQQTTKASSK